MVRNGDEMKRKLKLLLATNHSYMFYRFRKELMEELNRNYEVILSSPHTGHEQDIAALGIPVINIELSRRSMNPLTDLKLIREYRNLTHSEKPDLVITYSIKPNVYLSKVCQSAGIPYFCHVQGLGTAFQKPVTAKAASLLYRQAARGAEGVFFENQSSSEYFISSGLTDKDKVIQLHGAGVSIRDYPYSEPVENGIFSFLYLGRFMKEKGMDELLLALKELRKEGYQFVFDFAGFCEDEYQSKLDEICREGWGVNHGFTENPIPLYQKADCVVLPSWHEGMSNVLLEASSIGRPLITTNIPGCKEAVDEGLNGYLVPKQNPAALKNAMKKILNLSMEERRQMGKYGHEKMAREFSRDEVVRKTVEEIDKRTAQIFDQDES